MLELRNLTAGYPGHPVLSGVDLALPAGKVTVIAGPNGCGKSTLLKALAGLLPCQGDILLEGIPIPGESRLRAQKIAFLPQNRPVPEITVKRLVLHGRFPYLSYPRHYRAVDEAAAEKAMEAMEIGELAQRSIPSLSGGQRQKAYIAMVLAQDTPVVLLDEPNTYLDIAHQMQLMSLARDLADSGKTVVLVLHDLIMALEHADMLVVLSEGRVLSRGTPREVFGSGCLNRAFGVELKQMLTPEGWKYYYANP